MHDKITEIAHKRKQNTDSNCNCNTGNRLFEDKEITERWVECVNELYYDDREGTTRL